MSLLIVILCLLHRLCECSENGDQDINLNTTSSRSFYLNLKNLFSMREEELVELGKHNFKRRNYEKALGNYSNLIRMNPKEASYYVMRGNCYLALKDSYTATKDFENAVTIAMVLGAGALGLDANLIDMGNTLFKYRKLEKAVWCFTKAIEQHPYEAEYYSLREKVYNKMGEHDKSILDLKKVVELRSSSSNVAERRVLVQKLMDMERYKEATDEALLMDSFRLPEICEKLSKKNELELSIRCFSELINRKVNEGMFYEMRGNLYLKSKNVESAISDLKKNVTLNQTSSKAWYSLMNALLVSGKSNEALEEIHAADVGVLEEVANTFLTKNKSEYAIMFYKEAIRRNPSNAINHKLRGECYLKMGDSDMAIFDFKNALRKDPDNKEILILLKDVLFDAGRYKEAIDGVMKLDAVQIVSMAYKFCDLNMCEEAIRCFTEALKKDRQDAAVIHLKRGHCYQKLGKLQEALNDFQNAKKIDVLPNEYKLCYAEVLIGLQRYDEAAMMLDSVQHPGSRLTPSQLSREEDARKAIAAGKIA